MPNSDQELMNFYLIWKSGRIVDRKGIQAVEFWLSEFHLTHANMRNECQKDVIADGDDINDNDILSKI